MKSLHLYIGWGGVSAYMKFVLWGKLSEVCRVVEGGADEEERRATRLDGRIAWETEERVAEDL